MISRGGGLAAVRRMDEKEQRGKGSFLISGEPIRGLETEKSVCGLRLGVHLPVIVPPSISLGKGEGNPQILHKSHTGFWKLGCALLCNKD